MSKYVNPFPDFGFKKIFGEEINKELLIDFLNQLLPAKHRLKDLTYKKNENLGAMESDRRAIFDIYCESETGEKFIVELQKAKQNYFKDRSVYYSTFPIREQAERGEWNYELKAVYCIGILDFVFDEDTGEDEYFYRVQLRDEQNRLFYEKLTFIYLEMPKFRKREEELETDFDKWLYFIKNLERLEQIPERLRNAIFERAFETAEIGKFDAEEITAYEDSLKYYRDLKNVIDTSFEEGLQAGREEGLQEGLQAGREEGLQEGLQAGREEGLQEGLQAGREEGARFALISSAEKALQAGLTSEVVSAITGLSLAEIEELRKKLG